MNERCGECGRFLSYVDKSSESGFDFDLVCRNPICIAKENEVRNREYAGFVEFMQGELP